MLPRFAGWTRWGSVVAVVGLAPACGGGGGDGSGLDDTGNPPPTERPFCANEPPHKLCADFDNGPVEQDWTLLDQRGGGAIALSTDIVRSLPHSASTAGAGNSDAFAYLTKTFPGAPSATVKVAFDMRVEKSGDDGGAASVLAIKAAQDHDVTFNVGNAGEVLGCSATEFVGVEEPKSHNCVGGLRKQVWAHVQILITYSAGGGEVVVHLGRNATGEPFLKAPLTTKIGQELQISMGTRPTQAPRIGRSSWTTSPSTERRRSRAFDGSRVCRQRARPPWRRTRKVRKSVAAAPRKAAPGIETSLPAPRGAESASQSGKTGARLNASRRIGSPPPRPSGAGDRAPGTGRNRAVRREMGAGSREPAPGTPPSRDLRVRAPGRLQLGEPFGVHFAAARSPTPLRGSPCAASPLRFHRGTPTRACSGRVATWNER